ncbi:MAG: ATP-binding cassette domain-containing protein [Chloroflexota bacterium]|jgi:ABC-2 type transport system ATP-binding protein
MSDTAITARGLTKRYNGDILAVDGLDLDVPCGTIYALLGPNGAGKTTTVSMLTTLLRPTAGTATVAGYDVVSASAQVRARIGVTFQETVLDKDLRGQEVLDYHGRLYGMPRAERARRIAELLALVELDEAAPRLVKGYSGGMKRRLELARGLMTDPEVLFLDEPTQGLDPQNRAKVWEYLGTLRTRRGLTILLTTHDMEEADTLADRVAIVDHGKLIVEGTPRELVTGMGADVIRIQGAGESEALVEALGEMPFVQTIHRGDGLIQVGVDQGNRRLPEIVTCANQSGFRIEFIAVARPTLADVFLRHTGRALRDV